MSDALTGTNEGDAPRERSIAHDAKAATPSAVLEEQIVSSCVPKNEREWWAHREIIALRATITQQAQELAESERKLREVCMAHGPALIEIHDLKKEITQLERVNAQYYDDRKRLTEQLAASQARCREMEQKLNQSQEDF